MTGGFEEKQAHLLKQGIAFLRTVLFDRVEFTAAKITVLYLIFGFLALYLSDVVFVRIFDEPFLILKDINT